MKRPLFAAAPLKGCTCTICMTARLQERLDLEADGWLFSADGFPIGKKSMSDAEFLAPLLDTNAPTR